MYLYVKALTFDCSDALVLARFWADVLGSDVDEDSTPERAFVEAPAWGGPNMWFNRVPEPKTTKNRLHLDLHVPVTLSAPSTQTVTVQWFTGPAGPAPRADPATDFTAASGTVTFAPGDTSESVTISVNGDALVEPDEYLLVSFNHPTNAKMGGYYGLGFGLITNDD